MNLQPQPRTHCMRQHACPRLRRSAFYSLKPLQSAHQTSVLGSPHSASQATQSARCLRIRLQSPNQTA
jgi:hypothetical protein